MTDQSNGRHQIPKCGELHAGDSVSGVLLIVACEQRTKKNGEPYFFLTLRDRTGSIQCVMWDRHDFLTDGRAGADDFAYVEGTVSEFNNDLQMTLRHLHRVEESEVDIAEFLAVSARPRGEMEAELDALIESVSNTDCRRLLDRFFGHQRFRELYCAAPAAARIHQAWIGGLIEHTLLVLRNALHLGEQYKPYDRDLLVTAGIFHDVGKIREYDWRRSIVYTDEGRLLGHISIGASMVDSAIRTLQREPEGFSSYYHTHILHLILSHHGKMEYGSPVVPKTREALLLHYADYTEAYLSSFGEAVEDARTRGREWTSYNRMFDAYLHVPRPAEERAEQLATTLPASRDSPGGHDTHERPESDLVLDDTP